MKNKFMFWVKMMQYGLILLLAILVVIAAAAMPRWFLIMSVIAMGLIAITAAILKIAGKNKPAGTSETGENK